MLCNCMGMVYVDLLNNLNKVHTTKLGVERIRKNLGLVDVDDVVAWHKIKKYESAFSQL